MHDKAQPAALCNYTTQPPAGRRHLCSSSCAATATAGQRETHPHTPEPHTNPATPHAAPQHAKPHTPRDPAALPAASSSASARTVKQTALHTVPPPPQGCRGGSGSGCCCSTQHAAPQRARRPGHDAQCCHPQSLPQAQSPSPARLNTAGRACGCNARAPAALRVTGPTPSHVQAPPHWAAPRRSETRAACRRTKRAAGSSWTPVPNTRTNHAS